MTFIRNTTALGPAAAGRNDGPLGPGPGLGLGLGLGLGCRMVVGWALLFVMVSLGHRAAFAQPQPNSPATWHLQLEESGRVQVLWGSSLVTEYRYQEYKKPILYPVYGPGGHMLMRHFPMRSGVTGEAVDHPHHKSVWLAHGDVNGHSYWDERAEIQAMGAPQVTQDPPALAIRHRWLATGGAEPIATDETRIQFGSLEPDQSPLETGWWLQYQVKIEASHGDLKFGDTKEGFFAIRTHPNLRLSNDPRHGVTSAAGQAVNDRGQRDGQLWGKPAAWVAYAAEIEGQPITIVMMDHPTNLRHPTTWHAREYGLVAANPFGLHDFKHGPPGSGDFLLPAGSELQFCYRIAFLPSLLDEDQIRQAYQDFAASPNVGAAP